MSQVSVLKPETIFVPRFKEFNEIMLQHERTHWNVDEADMRTDLEQWHGKKITEGNKAFIKMTLRLFTQSDSNICSSYVEKLLPVFKQADVRMMLLSFAARETTHVMGYKKLNESLGYDTEAFAHEFEQYEALVAKHEFMIAGADLSTPLGVAKYLAKQILMEGINLFGAFAQLLSFLKEGKLPGMVSVNQWSITDESLHVKGLIALLLQFLREHPEVVGDDFKRYVYETYTQIIAIEDASIDLAYSVGENTAATNEQVKQYIRYIGDYRMVQMGLKPQFNIAENPLPFIEEVTGNLFGNFFEVTTIEYSKASLSGEWSYPEVEVL
jgi:ribonucleoside-diphosphate reductase beta chain